MKNNNDNILNQKFIDEFNNSIHNLNIITNLNIDEKLTIYNEILLVDTASYIQGLYRWWSSSSRIKTIKFINKMYKNSFKLKKKIENRIKKTENSKILPIIKEYSSLLKNTLEKSINGLNNLRSTYVNDINFCKKLNLIIFKLENL